jgi:hypothetical protein
MNSEPWHWNGERPEDANVQLLIRRLLQLRLTKYEFGFLTGLQSHNPTPRQSSILAKIKNRYAPVELEGNYDPSKNGASRADKN